MSRAMSTAARWCPTPEQLIILEHMFKSGIVRTPKATQLQQITTHLSYYGRIEAKNVFYWFQNHKARERQKLRRKLGMQLHQNTQPKCSQEEPKLDQIFHQVFHYTDDQSSNFNFKSLVSCPGSPQQMCSCCSTASSLVQGGCNEDEVSATKMTTWVKNATMIEICRGENRNTVKSNQGDEYRRHETLELFPIKDNTNVKEGHYYMRATDQMSDENENIDMSLSLSLSLSI